MMPYDGNAIAGTLQDVFGGDMTMADWACAECGQSGPIAEMGVYLGGPGVVGRCRNCDNVLLVITQPRGMYCVDLSGMSQVSMPPGQSGFA